MINLEYTAKFLFDEENDMIETKDVLRLMDSAVDMVRDMGTLAQGDHEVEEVDGEQLRKLCEERGYGDLSQCEEDSVESPPSPPPGPPEA